MGRHRGRRGEGEGNIRFLVYEVALMSGFPRRPNVTSVVPAEAGIQVPSMRDQM